MVESSEHAIHAIEDLEEVESSEHAAAAAAAHQEYIGKSRDITVATMRVAYGADKVEMDPDEGEQRGPRSEG